MSEKIIRIQHIRGTGVCMSGARDWFASHSLSWNDFLDNGLPVSQIRQLNDPLGNRVADFAEQDGEN